MSRIVLPSLRVPPFVAAMPTETVYGLAARIDLPAGIEAIFRIKERPFFDPLIVHVSSIEQAKSLVSVWSATAEILAQHFWPGPLTLVLPRGSNVNPMISSGLDTVGIRMPQHPIALELIRNEGVPLAAPSANRFGRTSPTSATHVMKEFGNQVPIIEGGDCQIGLESTVLRLLQLDEVVELAILRPGSVTKSNIEEVLKGRRIKYRFSETIEKSQAPGQMQHHYMPSVPLVLVRTSGLDDLALSKLVQFRSQDLPTSVEGVTIVKPMGFQNMMELKLSTEPVLASRQFYSELRRIADLKPDFIVFRAQLLHQGEAWQALFDRLTKAASLTI